MIYISNSPEETIGIGQRLGALMKGGEIIAYRGDLGAGKTTMTRGIALGMGAGDCVSSPTFAIVNEYHGAELTLYHFDMYRITTPEALEATGFYDYISKRSVIAVEWSENTEGLLDENITVDIRTDKDDPDKRTIEITGIDL
ncbi:MAG: tRNA (adenosine(37)-N6)-threonylcarbamoyltransferase complex ATPase subunit type 1 TsaE [Oscillospiraceae bacterium]|nr:tRNA (adenosine(37)-N6)-threonylcarbamoyltransferase complex ATPase subunit type 1 TsaE [Oscillospiraceae bacterium]